MFPAVAKAWAMCSVLIARIDQGAQKDPDFDSFEEPRRRSPRLSRSRSEPGEAIRALKRCAASDAEARTVGMRVAVRERFHQVGGDMSDTHACHDETVGPLFDVGEAAGVVVECDGVQPQTRISGSRFSYLAWCDVPSRRAGKPAWR